MHKCQIIQVPCASHALSNPFCVVFFCVSIQPPTFVLCPSSMQQRILSKDIVFAISTVAKSRGVRFAMPFLRQHFATAITENIGIWATHTTKASGVQLLYFMMMDNRLNFVEPFVTIGDVHKKQATTPSTVDIKKMLLEELANFHDDGTNILENGRHKRRRCHDCRALCALVHVYSCSAMLESMALMES